MDLRWASAKACGVVSWAETESGESECFCMFLQNRSAARLPFKGLESWAEPDSLIAQGRVQTPNSTKMVATYRRQSDATKAKCGALCGHC